VAGVQPQLPGEKAERDLEAIPLFEKRDQLLQDPEGVRVALEHDVGAHQVHLGFGEGTLEFQGPQNHLLDLGVHAPPEPGDGQQVIDRGIEGRQRDGVVQDLFGAVQAAQVQAGDPQADPDAGEVGLAGEDRLEHPHRGRKVTRVVENDPLVKQQDAVIRVFDQPLAQDVQRLLVQLL